MASDLAALAAAVAPVGGTQVAFVAAPGEAVKIALLWTGALPPVLLASNGLAAKTVMAVALNALVVAVDPAPRFSVTKEAVYHEENTDPEPIVDGTPANPVRSLFRRMPSACG
jgi:hypothetical protein